MFGYVIANPEGLDDAQKERYRACYCGLCRAIKEQFSSGSRLSLNYDMTFLVLLLSSLYEPEETASESRCVVHPVRKQTDWRNACTQYCAAMNVALAYYNCMDDWQDDRSLLKLAEAQLFRGARGEVESAYPRQTEAIRACLSELAALEQGKVQSPDRAANCFGRLMGELFVMNDRDFWAPTLRAVGEGLGRFVYLVDAAVDLESDLRRGRYNPLSELARGGRTAADFEDYLTMMIGGCAEAFERLPLVQDVDLLRNILYSGVWLQYRKALEKQRQKTNEGGPA